jgi:hypothetical protein
VAQIKGPARTMPPSTKALPEWNGTPEETAPHMNAHIGANHVMGLSNSSTARGAGNSCCVTLEFDWGMNVRMN